MANPNLLSTATSIELKTAAGKVSDDYNTGIDYNATGMAIINLNGNQSAKIISLYFCNESSDTAYVLEIGIGTANILVTRLFEEYSLAAHTTWIPIKADAPVFLDSTQDQFRVHASTGGGNYVDYVCSYELIST